MPRRKVRPPMEDAVASSPLFRLSPEVRNMIYTLLLVDSDSHHALFIPTDYFKRRKNDPPFRCHTCRQGFDNSHQFRVHQSAYRNGEPCKPPMHRLPNISTTLLRSCRLINTEAAPLLYRANTFYFNDPHTLQQFRWRTATYSKLSAWLEEITLELSDGYNSTKKALLWQNYLSGSGPKKKIWRLSADFPHLKRLTVVLTNGCLLAPPARLRDICNSFAQNLAGLDWVHVVGLNNSDMVCSLKPMVCTTESRNTEGAHSDLLLSELETVRSHTTEYESASGWKNVTLWRGSRGSRPPFVPSPLAGMGRERRHLFRIEANGLVTYETSLAYDGRRDLLMEQNARLLRRAKDQANHKPGDVALQQELGGLRVDILNRKFQSEITSQPRTFPKNVFHAQQDYSMQLMLLEQQNKKRLLMGRLEQEHGQTLRQDLALRSQQLRYNEQEDRLRSLEIWERHAAVGRSDVELTREISKAKMLVQQLQGQIDDIVQGYKFSPNAYGTDGGGLHNILDMTPGDFNGFQYLEDFDFDAFIRVDPVDVKHFYFKDGVVVITGS
ncbi:MAG: hypothetical protein Q9226_008637 [Calogaya cf. arnoldii]